MCVIVAFLDCFILCARVCALRISYLRFFAVVCLIACACICLRVLAYIFLKVPRQFRNPVRMRAVFFSFLLFRIASLMGELYVCTGAWWLDVCADAWLVD